ncbi:MAG: hypothetical protein JRG89_00815 [Deltaproteobacteria bacterium]|nr:hypothetical protein [Deltaproteobacteria bacterium]MBW2386950.1 hypothetical protein [Deltaproteobacteria bacterium]MBW2722991.1 hypothetical protein [Deltaproteobacteria bacterium]
MSRDENGADGWNAEKMLALARLHAQLETECKLDPLMDTLIEEPEYEFYPLNLRMRGGDLCRRYYQQFFDDFMQKISGYTLCDEWVSETSVAQEYDISLRIDGAIETHRVLGILFVDGTRLGGERIYGSERVIRLMAGSVIGEFEPF